MIPKLISLAIGLAFQADDITLNMGGRGTALVMYMCCHGGTLTHIQ